MKNTKFRLIGYDVCGNQDDGFHVNNVFTTNTFVELNDGMTDDEIVSHLISKKILTSEATGRVKIMGEFDFCLYFDDERYGEPLFELVNIRTEA